MLLKQALNTNLAQCELRVSGGTHLLSGPEVLQGHTLAAVVFQVVAGGDLHMGGRGTGQHLSALAQKGLLFFWPLEDKKHPKLLKVVHSALLHQTEQSYFH